MPSRFAGRSGSLKLSIRSTVCHVSGSYVLSDSVSRVRASKSACRVESETSLDERPFARVASVPRWKNFSKSYFSIYLASYRISVLSRVMTKFSPRAPRAIRIQVGIPNGKAESFALRAGTRAGPYGIVSYVRAPRPACAGRVTGWVLDLGPPGEAGSTSWVLGLYSVPRRLGLPVLAVRAQDPYQGDKTLDSTLHHTAAPDVAVAASDVLGRDLGLSTHDSRR